MVPLRLISPIAPVAVASAALAFAAFALSVSCGAAEGQQAETSPADGVGGAERRLQQDNVAPSTTLAYTTLSTATLPGTPDEQPPRSNEVLAFRQWKTEEAYDNEKIGRSCSSRFSPPSSPPVQATDLNGFALPDTCIGASGAYDSLHHIFVIGDWGGVLKDGKPTPADHRAKMFKSHHRKFVVGVDDVAQLSVAREMRRRALTSQPEYVINVGDNFYWGGILVKCGAPMDQVADVSGQWRKLFEDVYTGPGLDGKQWLGILGNHDWGGYMFTRGWDQVVAYTWLQDFPSKRRWVTPALYYTTKVRYTEFSAEYFFLDSNVFDAHEPHADAAHNLCSMAHNVNKAGCGTMGPASVDECPLWFKRLWDAQMEWLDAGLAATTATWQIIVTHFPPEHGHEEWIPLTKRYGVDLMIVGHRHQQEVHYLGDENFLRPTAYIVSGGGGGITSEGMPRPDGLDDQYGFMDLTLTAQEIRIEAISHRGWLRSVTCITQVYPDGERAAPPADSLCVKPSVYAKPGEPLSAGPPTPSEPARNEAEDPFAADRPNGDNSMDGVGGGDLGFPQDTMDPASPINGFAGEGVWSVPTPSPKDGGLLGSLLWRFR